MKQGPSERSRMEQQEQIRLLRIYVEDASGIKPKIRNDFELLAGAIAARLGGGYKLSTTTLMRIWGYVNEHPKTRVTTLNILAQYVGFINFDAFTESLRKNGGKVQSGILAGRTLRSSTLKEGDLLEIRWNPDRAIAVRARQVALLRGQVGKLQAAGGRHLRVHVLRAERAALHRPPASQRPVAHLVCLRTRRRHTISTRDAELRTNSLHSNQSLKPLQLSSNFRLHSKGHSARSDHLPPVPCADTTYFSPLAFTKEPLISCFVMRTVNVPVLFPLMYSRQVSSPPLRPT